MSKAKDGRKSKIQRMGGEQPIDGPLAHGGPNDAAMLQPLVQELSEALERRYPGLLPEAPLHEYISRLRSFPPVTGLGYVSPPALALGRAISERAGEEALARYHQVILIKLIQEAPQHIAAGHFPESIQQLFWRNFRRIIDSVTRNAEPPTFYRHSDPGFRKDLALCCLRLIPAGARKIHLHGLSRKRVLLGALRGSPWNAVRLWLALGGFKPLYEWHTDTHDADAMAEFNPEGWERFFQRVAELLRVQAPVRGAFGSSWLYDPQLDRVSPRHSYMRQFALARGAHLLCLGPCGPDGVANALAKSPTRRRRFEEGAYRPVTCLLAWPRRALLRWAASGGH